MTKEKLEDRIKTLTQEMEQLKSTMAAYQGAIQDCQHWLSQVEEVKTEDND